MPPPRDPRCPLVVHTFAGKGSSPQVAGRQVGVTGDRGSLGDMDAPLFVTDDPTLLDELQRLAAAAGVTPALARDETGALSAWGAAPAGLRRRRQGQGAEPGRPPRRAGVHVVGCGGVPDDVFRTALALGAENVAELPRSSGWVTELMADVGDTVPHGSMTIGVIGGSGGAGASTFACALGQMAARSAPAVVIDADPLGPGVDRVLGLDGHDGIRWDALCQTTGRFSGRSLRESLPRRDQLGVLTWYPGPQGSLQAFAVRNAVAAAQRGHETVVDRPAADRRPAGRGAGGPLRPGVRADRADGRGAGLGGPAVRAFRDPIVAAAGGARRPASRPTPWPG